MSGTVLFEWDGAGSSAQERRLAARAEPALPYDVAIIGAGVVGSALAWYLSQFRLRILLLDRRYDVGEGTSKGSSAIIHTGFDATPGTLESKLVTTASRLWPDLAQKLRIPFKPCGAVLVATDEEQHAQLGKLHQKAIDNGVTDVEVLDRAQVRQLVPAITAEARGGLLIPRESIIDPFSLPIAFSEVALANGTDLWLGAQITGVRQEAAGLKTLTTAGGSSFSARLVVNAAGLGGSEIARLYGGEIVDLNPRRGQFVIFDEVEHTRIDRILLPIPTAQSKGVLVIPTVFGNLLAGPTAEDLPLGDPRAADTTPDGLQSMLQGAARLMPAIRDFPRIGSFSGTRCACRQGTYLIRFNDGGPGFVTVSGIRSTGVTSSPALAEHIAQGLARECGLELAPKPGAIDRRPEGAWPGWWSKTHLRPNEIRRRPDYGRIVCNCRNISRGEIIDALQSPLHPVTLDAVKRRTFALTGRCQGFDCKVKIARMIAEHAGILLARVTKHGPGTEIIANDHANPG